MQTRQLGTSDMHITTVGFGAWAIGGGDWAFGWGAQEDSDRASAGEVAIAWVLQNPAVTGAIVGARSSEQVDGTVAAMDLTLAADDLAQIASFVRDNP